MKSKASRTPVSGTETVADFLDEPEFYKDLYCLDDPPDEVAMPAALRSAFSAAGYQVLDVEKSKTRPVWSIHFRRGTASMIRKEAKLAAKVLAILESVDVKVLESNLTVQRFHGSIIVAFFLTPPPPVIDPELQYWLSLLP